MATKKAAEKSEQELEAGAEIVPTKEKKERKRKGFVFNWPSDPGFKTKLEKKKGQAKIAVDILANAEEGKVWNAAEFAKAIGAHPDLPATLKGGKTSLTEKELLKLANFYVFDLRNNHAVKMVE